MRRTSKQIAKRVKEYHPFTCPRCDGDATMSEVDYNFSDDEFTNTYMCPDCGLLWINTYRWVCTEIEGVAEK